MPVLIDLLSCLCVSFMVLLFVFSIIFLSERDFLIITQGFEAYGIIEKSQKVLGRILAIS